MATSQYLSDENSSDAALTAEDDCETAQLIGKSDDASIVLRKPRAKESVFQRASTSAIVSKLLITSTPGRTGSICLGMVVCAGVAILVRTFCQAPASVLNCPSGYKAADATRCVAFGTSSCGQTCAKNSCVQSGGTWIPLDYSSNPFTCQMSTPPQGVAAAAKSIKRNGSLWLWHNELHVGPIEDLKNMFAQLQPRIEIRWFDHSFSTYCHFTHTCAVDAKVKSVLSFDILLSGTDHHVREFYEAYRDDEDMRQVDAFVCSHPPTLCRFFIPFRKPIIALLAVPFTFSLDMNPTPFYFNRLGSKWMLELRKMIQNKNNFVAVNNGALQKLANLELGLELPLVPNLCLYTGAVYHQNFQKAKEQNGGSSAKSILVLRQPRPEELCNAAQLNMEARDLKTLLVFHPWEDLQTRPADEHFQAISTDFAAVLYCPYTTSQMIFYETYNMNVPIVMPSLELATQNELHGRTIQLSHHPLVNATGRYNASTGFPYLPKLVESGLQVTRQWLSETDYYSGAYPHFVYFDNTTHLINLLHRISGNDLHDISKGMAKHTAAMRKRALTSWSDVLRNISLANNKQKSKAHK